MKVKLSHFLDELFESNNTFKNALKRFYPINANLEITGICEFNLFLSSICSISPSELVCKNGSAMVKSNAPLYPLLIINLLNKVIAAFSDSAYLESSTPFIS